VFKLRIFSRPNGLLLVAKGGADVDMVNLRFTPGRGIPLGCLISLLSAFFSNYSTIIKRFAQKLAEL
jgi:hypothetical protein